MPEAGPAEHELLRQSVRAFAANRSPETEVRRLMAAPHGFDREVWSVMAGQLGLQGMAIPERYGGAGFGWAELAIVFEEFGQALLCAPYFATVALAVQALLASDDEDAKQQYLPAIADGELVATVALQANATDEVTARDTAGGYELHGRRAHVIDGCTAGLLLDVESARSVAACAAAVAPDGPRLGAAAHMAKAYCSDVFVRVASANIQVHGGIGIAWDHSAHLYLKRAKSSQLLFGSPQQHRAALADLVRSAA